MTTLEHPPGQAVNPSPPDDAATHDGDVPAPVETPKRMTVSRMLELLLTKPPSGSYVSLTRAPNGGVTIDVKVTAAEAGSPTAASIAAEMILDALADVYPAVPDHEAATVSLTRNAKGETQIDVTGRTSAEQPSLEGLAARVEAEYDSKRRKYPMLDGRTAKPGSVE